MKKQKMVRNIAYISAQQAKKIKSTASKLNTTESNVVREALDLYFGPVVSPK